ncbi:TetR/AcrR family transcriptional regulator [Pimelobacter simplex]|uniref:Transcriptional regulator, TetR family n=1 Tax=Nocardioides simplex TaxID=2045 RepID=A0A0A1DQD3_NOCSI|nr:TetR/AcrR family transcriptional regulator C-terminal domain-containing protein [Pimelobacter simplex]AIY19549.1 transcriptional regulator, TetR family [Pimelobacter simplex]MCG8150785.1 TetR/AcrR family transcriptional regulator [Pimelobacter simplex]GEB15305.1 TetR family transcriptional regulator [Pimelobacter simplex]SFM83833.1 transcriptional regulator, TetR family [Pimelobacter simplex]
MPREIVDLLWRDHPDAPPSGRRGPKARVSASEVVDAAIALADADADGLAAVSVRTLAAELGLSAMSVYTHVNSRDDLLVLMADTAHARMALPSYGRAGWRTRVRRVAEANHVLLARHPWLLDVTDQRTALGPGTIAKYDHELAAFAPLGLDDVTCDAALTFVLDLVRSAARATRPDPRAGELAAHWPEWSARLSAYLGDDFALAQRVGAAAGAAMGDVADPAAAWSFALERALDGLAALRPGS